MYHGYRKTPTTVKDQQLRSDNTNKEADRMELEQGESKKHCSKPTPEKMRGKKGQN